MYASTKLKKVTKFRLKNIVTVKGAEIMRKKTEKSVEITLKETSVGTPSGEIKFVEGVDSKNLPICIVKP